MTSARPPDAETAAPHPVPAWTRSDWEAAADRLLDQAMRRLDRFDLVPALGGRWPSSTHHLQGFARSFLLAAYRLAAPARPPAADLVDRYVDVLERHLCSGRRRWPRPRDGEASVYEAAFLAMALHESRKRIWDRLPDSTRDQLVSWLDAAHRSGAHDNNWVLAPSVTGAFLASVGCDVDPSVDERAATRLDAWYRNDGCYSDGPDRRFDHYWGWGIHLLAANRSRIAGEIDAGHRSRLRRFLERYGAAVDPTGSPILVGRSPNYRLAIAGVFWQGALLGATPFVPGQTRTLCSTMMAHFAGRGAFGRRGPTNGWYRRHRALADPYSMPMSPWFCSVAFAGLTVDASHPLWTDPAADWRAATDPGPLGDSGFSLSAGHGVARLHIHRPSPAVGDARYDKLSYSSATGPLTGRGGRRHPDNELVVHHGGHQHRRLDAIGDGAVWRWTDGDRRGRVRSSTIVFDDVEVRVHRIEASDPVRVRDLGAAVAGNSWPTITRGSGWVMLEQGDVRVLTAGLLGLDEPAVHRSHRTSPLGSRSSLAAMWSTGSARDQVVASLHVVRRTPFDAGELVRAFVVEPTPLGVRVRHKDATRDVDLTTDPDELPG